jgi:hypothetical protein
MEGVCLGRVALRFSQREKKMDDARSRLKAGKVETSLRTPEVMADFGNVEENRGAESGRLSAVAPGPINIHHEEPTPARPRWCRMSSGRPTGEIA